MFVTPFVRGRHEYATKTAFRGVEYGRRLQTGRVDSDPDAVERTPPDPPQRALSRQRDSGAEARRVRLLALRSEVSIAGSRDERIAAVASRQRGRIASRQLRAIAVNGSSVAWLVSRGRLFPSLRCVFSVGHNAPIELGAETEALLSVREAAVLSHWSAAALCGLVDSRAGQGRGHGRPRCAGCHQPWCAGAPQPHPRQQRRSDPTRSAGHLARPHAPGHRLDQHRPSAAAERLTAGSSIASCAPRPSPTYWAARAGTADEHAWAPCWNASSAAPR